MNYVFKGSIVGCGCYGGCDPSECGGGSSDWAGLTSIAIIFVLYINDLLV